MKQPPVKLGSREREVVESAICETCMLRGWQLRAVNVRTNHVHAVISADKRPKAILSAVKANATRTMRESGLWKSELSPWSHGGSTKYLWDERELSEAIAYVELRQGRPLKVGTNTLSDDDGIHALGSEQSAVSSEQ